MGRSVPPTVRPPNDCATQAGIVLDGVVPTPLYSSVADELLCPSGVGLTNLGNSCYQNAIFQALRYSAGFLSGLLSSDLLARGSAALGDSRFSKTTVTLRNTLATMVVAGSQLSEIGNPVDTRPMQRTISHQFGRGNQEDAEEFLSFLLDDVCVSFNGQSGAADPLPEPAGSNPSLCMRGSYSQSNQCTVCSTVSSRYTTPFFMLRVPLPVAEARTNLGDLLLHDLMKSC